MNRRLGTLALAAFAIAGSGQVAGVARADQPPLKIGFITSYSGSTAAASRVAEAAINTWIAQHGDTVAGRKVLVIRRDDTGPQPETARRLAQELVVGDKVDFLAGIIYSPNAVAVGQVSAQSKTPFLVMNATQSKLTYGDPYMARFSLTLPQFSAPLAKWAVQNGIKSVFSIYLDYAPGIDAAAGFSQAFTAGGGTCGDMADGIISTGNYSANHDSKLNAAFVAAVLTADNGEALPDYNSVAIYDIMHAIYTVTAEQKGNLNPDRTLQLLRGMSFESPRGPLEIGRDSRDIIQTVYIRCTERRNGKFVNVEIASFPHATDPLDVK